MTQKCSNVQLEYDLAFRLLHGCGLHPLLANFESTGICGDGEELGICTDVSDWDVSSGAINSEGAGEQGRSISRRSPSDDSGNRGPKPLFEHCSRDAEDHGSFARMG